MTFVAEFEPTQLWVHFDTILRIPRGSKNEDQMRRSVLAVADRAGLSHQIDSIGNVVVRKLGTQGHEEAPITILQSHLDMVNEKNADHEHDFTCDPIVPVQVGDYLTADGTTLGSDNGVGVATMLAVMATTDLVHGPLEFLFTVDEETGLTGAAQLDSQLLEGRQLINLDSEEEGTVYVGCAGGGDSQLTVQLTSALVDTNSRALRLALKGLKGGHSGCDIHLQRGNAVKLLARALWRASFGTSFRLAAFSGGSAHNAIAREAFATVVVAASDEQALLDAIQVEIDAIQLEYRLADPGMAFVAETADPLETAWDDGTTLTVLRLITVLPHGVEAMSYEIPDLVETSSNIATVKQGDGFLTIAVSARSSISSALEALRHRIRATGSLAGASVEEDVPYPGWKPNLDSRLLKVVKKVHAHEFGQEPDVKAIHAGLECGIIGQKVPSIDMISFGPVIEFPHSPDERVHIGSVERFYRLLTATLEALA